MLQRYCISSLPGVFGRHILVLISIFVPRSSRANPYTRGHTCTIYTLVCRTPAISCFFSYRCSCRCGVTAYVLSSSIDKNVMIENDTKMWSSSCNWPFRSGSRDKIFFFFCTIAEVGEGGIRKGLCVCLFVCFFRLEFVGWSLGWSIVGPSMSIFVGGCCCGVSKREKRPVVGA